MTRAAATIAVMPFMAVLALASVPYVFWALGRGMLGDDAGAAAAIERSPLYRWFEWMARRNA